jgi:hypothetical protein
VPTDADPSMTNTVATRSAGRRTTGSTIAATISATTAARIPTATYH